jgi:hypothetical protein
MSLFYPLQRHGRFAVGYGLTPSLLHERYGLDYGERFHRDMAWRVGQLMEVDRAVHRDFGDIGLGFAEPFARASIEPYGHRFVPALYGCDVVYSAGEDPSSLRKAFDAEAIRALPAWNRERLEAQEPVRVVREQARWAREHCDRETAERRLGFTLHSPPLTSLQNLGSVINTAVSVFGDDALLLGLDEPELLRAFYRNVTDLMLLCLEYFPGVDGRRLSTVFVGNCTVAMISPAQYEACNLESDRRLAEHARGIGARFFVHQDSAATPHLRNYSLLGQVHGLDLGQDTDWTAAARIFPQAAATCIVFPSWIRSHSREEIRDELLRLMRAGAAFPSFTFSILELDVELAGGKIFEFHDAFRAAAGTASGTDRGAT